RPNLLRCRRSPLTAARSLLRPMGLISPIESPPLPRLRSLLRTTDQGNVSTHSATDAQGLSRLSAEADDPARTPARTGAAGLSLLWLRADRHAGPGVRRDIARQGRGRVRQADVSLP